MSDTIKACVYAKDNEGRPIKGVEEVTDYCELGHDVYPDGSCIYAAYKGHGLCVSISFDDLVDGYVVYEPLSLLFLWDDNDELRVYRYEYTSLVKEEVIHKSFQGNLEDLMQAQERVNRAWSNLITPSDFVDHDELEDSYNNCYCTLI